MMTKVECTVESCVHYLPEKACGAGIIEVGGNDADRVSITDCNTYAPRSAGNYLRSVTNSNITGIMSAVVGGSPVPGVKCRVQECGYNSHDGRCNADYIKIAGSTATTLEETECTTFTEYR